jgi:hypothetical protein
VTAGVVDGEHRSGRTDSGGYQNEYFAKNDVLRGVVKEANRVDSVLASSLAFIGSD